MNKRILAIGKVTKDYIITPTREYSQIGGAVFYQISTLNTLNYNVESIISIGCTDLKLLNDIASKVHIIQTTKTMQYTNIYDEKLRRTQKAELTKNQILPEHITINLNNITHVLLSPLSPYDIPPETITFLKQKGIKTVLIPQGYLRQTDENNNIIPRKWKKMESYLKDTDIICLDEKEAETAFKINMNDDKQIFELIDKYSMEQVIITKAEKGSSIYTQYNKHNIPAIKTEKEVDATGLGDTYIAAYIAKLEECDDIVESGLFASITAKEKLEQTGPLKTRKEEIERQLDEYR